MIVSLEEVKTYLRIDFSDDDNDLQILISGAELYLKNATGKIFDNTNALAKLYVMTLISDWYENRGLMIDNKTSDKIRFTLQSIMFQLQYCS